MSDNRIENVFQLDGKVPLKTAIPFGLQHILAMFVANLAPITIIAGAAQPALSTAEIAMLVQNAMFVAGIATMIQLYPVWKVGSKLPIVMGVSFNFVTILSTVAANYGYPTVIGAVMIGGIFEGTLGLFAKYWRKIISPVVAGCVVTAIGFSLFTVGTRSFGGGYAAMPLIQEQVVNLHSWLSMSEFTNLITIAEMTPGPIAVNSATFVGMQIAGILGAVIATLGCILPSCIIVTLLAYVYMKYRNMSLLQGTLASLRPAVVSMIAKAGVTILISAFFIDGTVNLIRQNVCVEMIIFFVIALVLLRKFKINPILAMVLCGVANVVLSAVKKA